MLAQYALGPPAQVTSGEVTFNGENLLDLEPDERAQQGVFLAFQYPVEIPGVANSDFLRLAVRLSKTRIGHSMETVLYCNALDTTL